MPIPTPTRGKTKAAFIAAAAVAVVPLVQQFEGLYTKAYVDPVGIPTICFGETVGVRMGDHKTPDECKTLLNQRMVEYAVDLGRCVPDTIPVKSYGALTSLGYNVGIGAVCKSSIPKKIEAGRYEAACLTMLDFKRAGGMVLRGLVRRRISECRMCMDGFGLDAEKCGTED